MKLINLSTLLLAGCVFSTMTAAKKTSSEHTIKTVEITRLSLDKATELARAAIVACRKKGIQVAASVVDRNGIVQVTLRDTLAAPLTLKISVEKAYTAANFNVATSALTRQSKSPLAQVDGLMMSSGAVTIKVGGKLLGAIGVSGAPSGSTDEECAKAGIKKLVSDLELDI